MSVVRTIINVQISFKCLLYVSIMAGPFSSYSYLLVLVARYDTKFSTGTAVYIVSSEPVGGIRSLNLNSVSDTHTKISMIIVVVADGTCT
eukprot:SAG31_NODE_7285_length_1731_cov_3.884804_1_plen_89_part_10